MSELADKKPVSTPKVVSMMSKITEDKLIGPNYLDWSKTFRLYLRSIRMVSHFTEDPLTDDSKDPPTDDLKDRWLEDDAPVSFFKSVIPLMVKYLLSLIIVSLLRS